MEQINEIRISGHVASLPFAFREKDNTTCRFPLAVMQEDTAVFYGVIYSPDTIGLQPDDLKKGDEVIVFGSLIVNEKSVRILASEILYT